MPLPIPEALADAGTAAVAKASDATRRPARYLLASAFAGAYVGVAVVLLVSVGTPLVAAGSPFAKLVMGSVFGIALTLVVFAGAELFTGNVMFLLQGVATGKVSVRQLLAVWAMSLGGNIAGSVGFAALVHGGGTVGTGPGAAMLAAVTAAKDAASGPQLFWRAVLCNMLVCLALWMAARTKSDGAKLAVLWWALLAFIGSGFEHSIANVTIFALAVFNGSATWGMLVHNLAWTVPGNVVGGGVLVGLAYAYLGKPVAARPVIHVEAKTVEDQIPLPA